MIGLDSELIEEYLEDCRNQLHHLDTELRTVERDAAPLDDSLINRVHRTLHSVRGGAGVFELTNIRELALRTQDVLQELRANPSFRTPDAARALRSATARLCEFMYIAEASNQAYIGDVLETFAKLRAGRATQPAVTGKPSETAPVPKHLRMLLVEDDFASRLLLQTFLSRYGECHIAVNGLEAVEAFNSAIQAGQGYDLICMDIMMPKMDGCEAVKQVRAIEAAHGILSTTGAKIIMTTTVDDIKEVFRCFKELCDAYLVKPIDLVKLLDHMKSYRLLN